MSAARPELVLIAAVARNGVIGRGNELVFRDAADLRHFRQATLGSPVLMGRKTWQSLPERFRPLPGRHNIVLSRDPNHSSPDSVTVLSDPDAVLDLAKSQDSHLFVIGGAQVYESFRPHIERWIVTEVPIAVEGADTFMPPDFLDGFEMYELRQLDEGLRVKFHERKT